MSNETVARYPFSLTVHMKNGSPLYLDRAIHLNGDWEMCLSQLYLPRSEITVFSDCKIEFRYDLLPKQSPKTEKDRLWNEKLKRLRENEKKQTITISIVAGNYDTEVIIDLINQAIQDNEDLQTYRQKTKLVLSNGKSFFREIPKIMDAQGRTAFQLQDEIKSIGISRELAYLLGFVNHPKHGIPFITMNNSSKHALLSSHQRPPNGGIFYYFLYCDLIEYQSIGNQRAPLLQITPAVETSLRMLNLFNSNTCTIIEYQRISLPTSYLKFVQNLVNSYSFNIPIHCMCFIFVQECTKFYK